MDASIMRELTSDQLKTNLPEFSSGDTRIRVRVIEGDKTHRFLKAPSFSAGSGIQETVTVRKITQGVATERIFPLHSPRIAEIECTRRGRVRRARLFYLRSRKGRAARIREKR